ncbi:MAG TPA: hypothetical protein ENN19_06605 [Chloroflexi bacterium]|nr:hypothetical protein [Chloroflexota bacterium]
MSRVIATRSPGKIRNQHRRTIAEAVRRLSQKAQIDQESKDLAALIVFCLQGMSDTVDQTIEAWEKRDYWLKAERFREEWRWIDPVTDQLSTIIHQGQWEELPAVLASMMPHFSDVKIRKMTRKSSLWQGAFDKFMGASES